MMRFLVMAGLALLLLGCGTAQKQDGYQLGDGLGTLLEAQQTYCAEADPVRRAVVLALIRSQVPGYPPRGLCTDAEQKLAEEVARRVADGEDVDIEAAIEEQRRYQEAQDAGHDSSTTLDGEILREGASLDRTRQVNGDHPEGDAPSDRRRYWV